MFKEETTMKKQAYRLVALLVLVSMITISTAKAQSGNQPLVATIPFEFSLGGQALSAGQKNPNIPQTPSYPKEIQLNQIQNHRNSNVLSPPQNMTKPGVQIKPKINADDTDQNEIINETS